MTMINCLTLGHAGYMMCDTAVYLKNLQLLRFRDKIEVLEKQRMLLAISGADGLSAKLASAIDASFESFDDFISGAELFLRRFDRDQFPLLDESLRIPGTDGRTAVFVVGFSSARRKAECWSVEVTGGSGSIASTALVLNIEPSKLVAAPGLGGDRIRRAGLFGPEGFGVDPEGSLLHLAELQRWAGVPLHGTIRYYVGGEVVLARIDEHGITKRVLKDWGDEIGHLIVPSKLAPPPRPLSREEALARKQPGHTTPSLSSASNVAIEQLKEEISSYFADTGKVGALLNARRAELRPVPSHLLKDVAA